MKSGNYSWCTSPLLHNQVIVGGKTAFIFWYFHTKSYMHHRKIMLNIWLKCDGEKSFEIYTLFNSLKTRVYVTFLLFIFYIFLINVRQEKILLWSTGFLLYLLNDLHISTLSFLTPLKQIQYGNYKYTFQCLVFPLFVWEKNPLHHFSHWILTLKLRRMFILEIRCSNFTFNHVFIQWFTSSCCALQSAESSGHGMEGVWWRALAGGSNLTHQS